MCRFGSGQANYCTITTMFAMYCNLIVACEDILHYKLLAKCKKKCIWNLLGSQCSDNKIWVIFLGWHPLSNELLRFICEVMDTWISYSINLTKVKKLSICWYCTYYCITENTIMFKYITWNHFAISQHMLLAKKQSRCTPYFI